MEFSLILANKIAVMLIWAVIGYIVVRTGTLKSEDSKALSTFLIYVFTPCTIIHAFQINLTKERLQGLVAALLFSAAAQGLFIILTALFEKPFKLTAIDKLTLVFPNCGNLILPLVEMILGSEYTFYVAAYISVFHIFLWTYGVIVMRGKEEISLKKLVLNPNLIAVGVGMVFLFGGIRLPSVIDSSMAGLSDMIGPSSMLVIGMMIAEKDVFGAFRFLRAYPVVFGRMIFYPVILLLLLYATGILKTYPFLVPVLQVSTLSACAPPATFVSQLAVVYDREPYKAGAYNIVGTILCVVTMPLMILLYQFLF